MNKSYSELLSTLEILHENVSNFKNYNIDSSFPSSIDDVELKNPERLEILSVAYSQANILIEHAAEHFIALQRTLTEPILTIAPWSCLRALLETSALACWIINPEIDIKTRIGRSYALRFEDLCQQLRYSDLKINGFSREKIENRIDLVEQLALSMGYK